MGSNNNNQLIPLPSMEVYRIEPDEPYDDEGSEAGTVLEIVMERPNHGETQPRSYRYSHPSPRFANEDHDSSHEYPHKDDHSSREYWDRYHAGFHAYPDEKPSSHHTRGHQHDHWDHSSHGSRRVTRETAHHASAGHNHDRIFEQRPRQSSRPPQQDRNDYATSSSSTRFFARDTRRQFLHDDSYPSSSTRARRDGDHEREKQTSHREWGRSEEEDSGPNPYVEGVKLLQKQARKEAQKRREVLEMEEALRRESDRGKMEKRRQHERGRSDNQVRRDERERSRATKPRARASSRQPQTNRDYRSTDHADSVRTAPGAYVEPYPPNDDRKKKPHIPGSPVVSTRDGTPYIEQCPGEGRGGSQPNCSKPPITRQASSKKPKSRSQSKNRAWRKGERLGRDALRHLPLADEL